MTQAKNLIEELKKFFTRVDSEIDFAYFLDDFDINIDDDSDSIFQDLLEHLDDSGAFNVEIIYYSRAIEYLRENDPSLRESLELASDMGYNAENLNSEILASILASDVERSKFYDLESEIVEIINEFKEQTETEA